MAAQRRPQPAPGDRRGAKGQQGGERQSAVITVAVNRRALHDYEVLERLEAGLALTGTEIKAIRAGHAHLREGYIRVSNGEAWLEHVHIAPYEHGTTGAHDPLRPRKLLLHKDQIGRLAGQIAARGSTAIPLRLYVRRGLAKLEIGIARGRREYDKRQAIAERESRREMDRARARLARGE